MFNDPLTYIPAVSGVVGILSAAGILATRIRSARREATYRRWTAQQEAHLAAGGLRFKLQVLRKDKDALAWAVSQGRLRVTKNMPWGWYVVAETRLSSHGL